MFAPEQLVEEVDSFFGDEMLVLTVSESVPALLRMPSKDIVEPTQTKHTPLEIFHIKQ